MQRKVFWMTFAVVGLIADVALPFWWASSPRSLLAWPVGGSPTARVVLAIIRQSETGAGSIPAVDKVLPANGPKAWQAHKPDNCCSPGRQTADETFLGVPGRPEVLAQRYQRLRSFFGTGPLFQGSVPTPNINLDVGLLSSGHTDTIADLLRNGVPARYELETNGDHGVLEIRAKSSGLKGCQPPWNSAFSAGSNAVAPLE